MELHFTPYSVSKLEKETGKAFYDVMAEMSVTNMLLFVKYGTGSVDDETASKTLEVYMSDGSNDISTLSELIMEALQRCGFLPKALKIKGALAKEMEKEVSQKSGKKEKE
jgi:hypothetical protein